MSGGDKRKEGEMTKVHCVCAHRCLYLASDPSEGEIDLCLPYKHYLNTPVIGWIG